MAFWYRFFGKGPTGHEPALEVCIFASVSSRLLDPSGTIKREVNNNTCQTHSQPPISIDTQTTSKGILTMGNLLLNSLASHHSRAFRDLKKEHPGQVDLLVGQNNSGEMVMRISKQTASSQKITEQNARYLLTILTRTRYRHSSCEI